MSMELSESERECVNESRRECIVYSIEWAGRII